jgi:hypothetical protein
VLAGARAQLVSLWKVADAREGQQAVMTAAKYPQRPPGENSLGLHYSRFQPRDPHKSSAYLSKNPKAEVESAKLG